MPDALEDGPTMSESLNVNEIYLSLQGESTYAGLPCIFVRLTGCNLRCSYCDTAYAFTQGTRMPLEAILERVESLAKPFNTPSHGPRLPLIELTGGEPLLQPAAAPLMQILCDKGYEVLVETSGAWDISNLHPSVHRIMDLKCPSSGESHRNRAANIPLLTPADEVKFVISTHQDYQWVKEQLRDNQFPCTVLLSWAAPLATAQQDPSLKPAPEPSERINLKELAEAIIADRLPVRFQLQQHKYIWPPDQRGV